MQTLKPFWQFLEKRPSGAAVLAQWKSRIGDVLPLITGVLRPCEGLAQSYPHPIPEKEPLRVVKHRDGTWVAVSEEDRNIRVNLTRDDLVVHQVDARKLRAAIASALPGVAALQTGGTPLSIDARNFRVGYWRPKPAADFPIDLLIPRDAKGLESVIQVADTKGTLLLTPTDSLWLDEIRQLAVSRKVKLVSLAEIIDVSTATSGISGNWAHTEAWNSYLGAFTQMIGTSLPANYQNKRKQKKRAVRLTAIEKIEKALEDHLRAARDHAFTLQNNGRPVTLMPRPEQQELAALLGLTPAAVSRCINDPKASKLKILWESANSLPDVLRFNR